MSIYKGTEFIAGTPDLSEYVHKTSNETINGVKTFSNSIIKTTSTVWENIIQMSGTNFPYIAGFSNDSETALALCTFHNNKYNNIEIRNNGTNGYVTCPPSDVINSIVTTYAISKSGNGYVKFGNGIIIQWGFNALSSNPTTITFPTAFSSTNYSIAIAGLYSSAYNDFGCRLHNLTTTTFQAYRGKPLNGIRWIAIGY